MVDEHPASDLSAVTRTVAVNVREQRKRLAWTLDALASRAGLSKGIVVQVEQGRANPSLATLSKLGEALGLSVSDLIAVGEAPAVRVVESSNAPVLWKGRPGSKARLLIGSHTPDLLEMWDWSLAPGEQYEGRAHGPESRELITVAFGELVLTVSGQDHVIRAGDSVSYEADRPHSFANVSSESVSFVLVVVDPGGAGAH
jgi:quercetin dioxygenase-like cupin family protein